MAKVAVGLVLLIVYTYLGYPLLVALLARIRPRPVAPRGGFEPSVSICLSVHDGEAFLEQKLQSLQALDYPADKLEILVYSDGSTDRTEELTREHARRDPRIRLLSSAVRLGKPTGLNRLRESARGDVLLMTDVRQTLSRGALRALLEPLSDPRVGCVSGSLELAGNTGPGAYWLYEKFIRNCEARLGSMVGVSGSLYAIRRVDLQELPTDVLLDDMFVPLSTVLAQKRIVLSPDAAAYDQAYDDEREFGRKVRTLAGNYQLLAMLPWLLVPFKNPVWFQLVSHKLLRLVCPFALLALLVASLLLVATPGSSSTERLLWQGVIFAHLGLLGLAACGARAGRLGSLARTFVVLNVAAVVGLWRFLRKTQDVAW